MQKSYTVLITSAIYTNYGIYSRDQRIEQTMSTIASVRKYLPNATIVLIENSKREIQNDESEELQAMEEAVDFWIDNSDDEDIQYFHDNIANYDIGKNAMECIGTKKSLDYILQSEDIMEKLVTSSRVFKLSGRYELTEQFDINKFDNPTTAGKYVFKKSHPSWIPTEDTGVTTLLQTRLWSFAPTQLIDTITLYKQIIENMFATFNKQKYIDVEHSMSKFIPDNNLVQLDTIGLKGNIAPNGVPIID